MKHCAKCRGEFPDDLIWCPVCTTWPAPRKAVHRHMGFTADELYPSLADMELQMDVAHGKDWKDI